MAAAPTTCPPAAVATCIVSRVEPPVVQTSSTTSTRSDSASTNPRRRREAPSWRSAKIARTPSARPTSWPMIDAAKRRREHGRRTQVANPVGDGARRAVRPTAGMLQHERGLQVASAVQAGGQTEVSLEQGARPPEQVEQFVTILVHPRLTRVPVYNRSVICCNRTGPSTASSVTESRQHRTMSLPVGASSPCAN